jgi:hypothetical protein
MNIRGSKPAARFRIQFGAGCESIPVNPWNQSHESSTSASIAFKAASRLSYSPPQTSWIP